MIELKVLSSPFVDITRRRSAEHDVLEAKERLAIELAAMTRLHDLVSRLWGSPDLTTALGEVLDAAIDITGAKMGNVHLRNQESGQLEIVAQRGFSRQAIDVLRSLANLPNAECQRVAVSGQRVVIEDVQSDSQYEPLQDFASSAGYRAVQATPLINRNGELLGILSTHYSQPHQPSDRDLQVLDLYARQAADFIDHVRIREASIVADRRKDEFLASIDPILS